MKVLTFFMVVGIILVLSAGPVLALDPIDQALIFLEQGMDDQAIEILTPLLASEDEERLSHVVEILYSQYSYNGTTERTMQALETFINRFPQSSMTPLYLYWKAKMQEDFGHHAGAREIYRELIDHRLTVDNDIYQLLPLIYEDLAFSLENHQRDYPAAIQTLEQLLQGPVYPDEQGRIMNQIASLHELMNNVERAKQIYREVVRDIPACPARNLAALRLIYLESEPTWARHRLDDLTGELKQAFSAQNLEALSRLAIAGDFRFGLMYSEFEIGEFSLIEPYLAEFLPFLTPVFRELEPTENGFHVKIENWPDPEYDIMYLVIEEGLNGWEWIGIVLSSQELEASFW